MKTWISVLGVVAMVCVSVGKARADAQPLFEDTFTSLDPALGVPSASLQVNGGKLVIAVTGTNKSQTLLYQVGFFSDADTSVTFSCTSGDTSGANSAAIIFWGVDTNNFYFADVSTDGSSDIYRRSGGRWLHPAAVPVSPSVNKGTGTSNVLRVVTSGKQATLYINGNKMATITGMPPDGGGVVGYFVESSSTSPCTWTAQDFKVLPLPK